MASNTRQVEGIGQAVFDFNTTRRGTVSFFSNDLNITWVISAQGPNFLVRLHSGPILFIVTNTVDAGARITAVAQSIGNSFEPPRLSLLQVQTDAVLQV